LSSEVIQETACVRLEVENRPENVALVRAALAGFAEASDFDEELATDLKTAVSEACNNVVIHAYEGDRGPMRVLMRSGSDSVDVIVTDFGTGIRRLSGATDHMGLGLALISALADQAEFTSPSDGGTEVRMRFRRTEQEVEGDVARVGEWPEQAELLEGDVVLWCAPAGLVRHLLGRVGRALAASSHFTISGASDLYAVNDAVAEYAEAAADGEVMLAFSSSSHRLTLDAGPFMALDTAGAHTERAPGEPEPGGTSAFESHQEQIAELVDQLSVERFGGGGMLHMLLLDHGRDTAN
jgi:serine/threonine-protein kinase RsbW